MTIVEKLQQKKAKIEAQIASEVVAAQSKCKHRRIALDPGFRTYGTYHPERICMDCGYHEVGGWWCYSTDCTFWHAKESDNAVLGHKEGRTVVKVGEEEFRSYRI